MKRQSESGAALLAALFLIAIAFLVVAAVTWRATKAAQESREAAESVRALNVAEGAFAIALERLAREPFSGDSEGEIATCPYTVVVHHEFGTVPRRVVLDCEATCGLVTRGFSVTLGVRDRLSGPPDIELLSWKAGR